jgi:hypothetical protein
MFAGNLSFSIGKSIASLHGLYTPHVAINLGFKNLGNNTQIFYTFSLDVFLIYLSQLINIRAKSLSRKEGGVRTLNISCAICSTDVEETCFHCDINFEELLVSVRLVRICPHQSWQVRNVEKIMRHYISPMISLDSFMMESFDAWHPLRVIGRKYFKIHRCEGPFRELLFDLTFCETTQFLRNNAERHASSIEDLLLTVGTRTFVRLGYPPRTLKKELFPLKGKYLLSGGFLLPWAKDAILKCNYLVLDATFSCLRPYVTAFPICVLKNSSIPIGCYFNISENTELYHDIYDGMRMLEINDEVLLEKPVITDQGKALKSILKSNTRHHFLCFRHLIERIGSNSILGIITRRLLFTSSKEEFKDKIYEAMTELRLLLTNEIITHDQLKKFFKIFNVPLNLQDKDDLSDDVFPQAIWNRTPFGVGTTTNHGERFHLTIELAQRNLKSFLSKLTKIILTLKEVPSTFYVNQNRQLKEKIKSMKCNALALGTGNNDICTNSNCQWSDFYSSLFGITGFPCIHTILKKDIKTNRITPFPESEFLCPSYQEIETDGNISLSHTDDESQQHRLNGGTNPITLDTTSELSDFLMQTSRELLMINDKKFRNWTECFCHVGMRWARCYGNIDSARTSTICRAQFFVDTLLEDGIKD